MIDLLEDSVRTGSAWDVHGTPHIMISFLGPRFAFVAPLGLREIRDAIIAGEIVLEDQTRAKPPSRQAA